MMGIDIERLKTDAAYWDECGAPEDATHADAVRARFLRNITGGWWIWCSPAPGHGFWEATSWPSVNPEHIIPRPTKPEPQEWDGEWPPTNTPCEVTTNDGHNWHETELLYSDNNVVLLRGYELYKKADPDVRCRPLRTKEQRQMEELANDIANDLEAYGIDNPKHLASCLAVGMINRGWHKGEQ